MKAKGTKVKLFSKFYYPESLETSINDFIESLPDNAYIEVEYVQTTFKDSIYYSALIMYNIDEDEI